VSVTTTVQCRLVPLTLPVGPDEHGLIANFRFIGSGACYGDASGGVAQFNFNVSTGLIYNESLWKLDDWSLYADPVSGATRSFEIEVRGGELALAAEPVTWMGWGQSFQGPNNRQNMEYTRRVIPLHPFRLEGQNSFVRVTTEGNVGVGTNWFCHIMGRIFLPVPASYKSQYAPVQ
jgi:hypothetical protein